MDNETVYTAIVLADDCSIEPEAATSSADPQEAPRKKRRGRRLLFRLLLLAIAVSTLSFLLYPADRGEAKYTSWRHHQQARLRFDPPQYNSLSDPNDTQQAVPVVKWVYPWGNAIFTTGIFVTDSDVDWETERSIRGKLAYDWVEADRELCDAQKNLPGPEEIQQRMDQEEAMVVSPSLTARQTEYLRSGCGRMVRIRLFDTCGDDGEVVLLSLNEHPFATVALSKAGTELCVPINVVNSEENCLEFRALHEGRDAGVTMGLETSQGTGFLPSLSSGGTVRLQVLTPKSFQPLPLP